MRGTENKKTAPVPHLLQAQQHWKLPSTVAWPNHQQASKSHGISDIYSTLVHVIVLPRKQITKTLMHVLSLGIHSLISAFIIYILLFLSLTGQWQFALNVQQTPTYVIVLAKLKRKSYKCLPWCFFLLLKSFYVMSRMMFSTHFKTFWMQESITKWEKRIKL